MIYYNCLDDSDIVLGLSILGIILNIKNIMHRVHANTTPFHIGFEHPWIFVISKKSWNQSPKDPKG